MYTAPIYLLVATAVISIIMLLCCFDGKMKLMKTKAPPPIENEVGESQKPKGNAYNQCLNLLYFQPKSIHQLYRKDNVLTN
jgi:hypothetical protein